MSGIKKIAGIVLIAAGVLGLVYKGFNYTKETHKADLGPLKFEVKEKDRVEVPTWVSIVAIAAGAGVLLVPTRRG